MPLVTFDESSSGIDDPSSVSDGDGDDDAKLETIRVMEELFATKAPRIVVQQQQGDADRKQDALQQLHNRAIAAGGGGAAAFSPTAPEPFGPSSSTTETFSAPAAGAPAPQPGAFRMSVLPSNRGATAANGRGPPRPDDQLQHHHDRGGDDADTLTAFMVDEDEERHRLEQATREAIEKSTTQAVVVNVKRRLCVAGMVATLALVVIVSTTVVFTKTKTKPMVLTAYPTVSPTVHVLERSEWTDFANEITLELLELQYPLSGNNDTAAGQALAWFIDHDPTIPERRAVQRFAFVVLSFAMNIPAWTIQSGFDECKLYGVTCNSNDTVIEIDLTEGGITGSIPNDIALLTSIRKLVLWDNALTGTVPWDLMVDHMTVLNFLDLDLNELTGSLPAPRLGSWPQLEIFWISGNNFVGTLSPGFANLASLRDLYVGDNQLTGTVPTELGNISTLEWFAVYDNKLTGSLPTEIGMWSNIVNFEVQGNAHMTGTIPTEVGRWTAVKNFFCNSNELHGILPTEMNGFTNLVGLRVAFNDFTGPLPSGAGWTDLDEFFVNNNAFTGRLPNGMGNWTKLVEIKVNNNQLTGPIPEDDLAAWTDLQTGQFQVNRLTGTVDSLCAIVVVSNNKTAVTADCCEVRCPCCSSCFTDDNDDEQP
jgi:hypothetical protein